MARFPPTQVSKMCGPAASGRLVSGAHDEHNLQNLVAYLQFNFMKQSIPKMIKSVTAALVLLLAPTALASAAEFEVDMVNKGADGSVMAFEPALTKVAVGDTVHFVA